jgi:PadR family transcriptional regulator
MIDREPYRNRIELLQGTLDLLVLQALTWGAQHGYGLTQAIRATSREVLQVDTGSLYPALHRLEREGSVASEWKTSENNQRVKI